MRGQIEGIEKKLYPQRRKANFAVGDTVEVQMKVQEGDRERVQSFEGLVIAIKNAGINQTFLVRRVVQGEGIERVFPLQSPRLVKVVVKKRGRVRRAKLYYLRERVGRAGKVQEVFSAQEGGGAVASAPGVPGPSVETRAAEVKAGGA